MSRASRSKTQPEFDPRELEDLIHTPAVGKGVGSHLVAEEGATGVTLHRTPVVMSDRATVDIFDKTTVDRLPVGAPTVWVTEAGQWVPASRVKPIQGAGDVLNAAETAVYHTLWGAPAQPERELTVQAGYELLMKRTGLSRKTIQRVIDRLIEKGFLAVERPADIYRRTATVYRVYSDRAVLERQAGQGRRHVVKIGPGMRYVRRLGG